jgi:hypothetical protein
MLQRVIRGSVAGLILVIAVILGGGYAFCTPGCKSGTENRLRDSLVPAPAPCSPRRTPYLVFSTYLGGSIPCMPGGTPLTYAQSAAGDAQGNTYVTGATQVYDLPVLHACQPSPAADSATSAFVAKYNPFGKLLWCTYLGGNNQSKGVGVAVMPDGGVAVSGLTTSDASGPFPTLNAFQEQNNGQSDYFVTVFDANGNQRYSTYLGGSGVEGPPSPTTFAADSGPGNNVAVDAAGLVYVTGFTDSGGGSGATKFPVTANALQSDLSGLQDAFLCIIDPTKSGAASLVYSSFLGGTHNDQGHSVTVDSSGLHITVVGFTHSSNFPTTPSAYRSAAPPAGFLSNGFVTQIGSSNPGSLSSVYTMLYSTYLGANTDDARDDAYGVTLDAQGLLVVTGRTQSAEFPMTLGGATIYNSAPYLKAGVSNDQPYVVKLDPTLSSVASLAYSTFLGGGSADDQWGSFCTCVGVDALGTVYVGGETLAPGLPYVPNDPNSPQEFPYTPNALFTANQGSYDAICMRIDPGGATLGYSTFLGGEYYDSTYGLAIDPAGNVVLAGLTFSQNFPVVNPAQRWPGITGVQNAFVTKFSVHGINQGVLLLLLND